jgi:choloylglycine hydrolase
MRLLAATSALGLSIVMAVAPSDACTRFVYETGAANIVIGRSMDWAEDPGSDLWAFPAGMERNGGVGEGSITWTSRHGSLVTNFYDGATVDGMNTAGLVANALYLAEADYGEPATSGKPLISIGAWTQYALDNFATAAEAAEALATEPFAIVAPVLPNGRAASGHLALTDKSGDTAIFEYIDGRLVIHHGSYPVMTNSPTFDQQLAIDSYWNEVGGVRFLPGTYRSTDRFARMSWNVRAAPRESDPQLAVATAFSLIRAISVPLGLVDPEKPNIAATIWRTVSDTAAGRYYFDSAYSPAVFWVDLAKLDLSPGALAKALVLDGSLAAAAMPACIWRLRA